MRIDRLNQRRLSFNRERYPKKGKNLGEGKKGKKMESPRTNRKQGERLIQPKRRS